MVFVVKIRIYNRSTANDVKVHLSRWKGFMSRLPGYIPHMQKKIKTIYIFWTSIQLSRLQNKNNY